MPQAVTSDACPRPAPGDLEGAQIAVDDFVGFSAEAALPTSSGASTAAEHNWGTRRFG